MPMVGGFVADAYLGRGRTIVAFSLIYLIGLSGLTLSATIPSIAPSNNPSGTSASTGQMSFFWLSM